MSSIITTLTHRFIAAVIKAAWAIHRSGARTQALGERVEAWADQMAVRYRCVDAVTATITAKALSR